MKKLLFQILNIITIIKLTSSQISNYIFRLEKGEKECLQDFFPSKFYYQNIYFLPFKYVKKN